MESQSPPISGAAQVLRDEEALKASDIHAQGIIVTMKEALRDDKDQISCDGCTSIPYALYQFSRIMVAFHILWPLVLYGCGILETSALPIKVLWTFPIWSGTLSAIAYIIWVSMKPYVYFFNTGIEECSDPRSTTHYRGQLRISSHRQVAGLAGAHLTSRWAVRILILDTYFSICTIIGTGWERMRFTGCSNCELAFKGASSAIGITLLIFSATILTKLLLVVVERLHGYIESPQGKKLYAEYYQTIQLADADLRTTVNKPRAGDETAQEKIHERETSAETVKASKHTLPTQFASLEAQVAELSASNTHNEVLAIGLRKRVRHLEDYIDHLLKQPPTFDETRFATTRELPDRRSQAAQSLKDTSMETHRELRTEDPETQQADKTLDNVAFTHDEASGHQSPAQHASCRREECRLRVEHGILQLRLRITESAKEAKENALSVRPSREIGVVANIVVTPEQALENVGVDAGSEWEEV